MSIAFSCVNKVDQCNGISAFKIAGSSKTEYECLDS